MAREFAASFFGFLGSLAATGKLKLQPNPLRRMPGGLERIVPDGFALLRGRGATDKTEEREEEYMRPISGEKLVYTVQ